MHTLNLPTAFCSSSMSSISSSISSSNSSEVPGAVHENSNLSSQSQNACMWGLFRDQGSSSSSRACLSADCGKPSSLRRRAAIFCCPVVYRGCICSMRFACLSAVFNHPRIVAWCHSFVVDDYQRSAERRTVVNNRKAYDNETRETSTAPKM